MKRPAKRYAGPRMERAVDERIACSIREWERLITACAAKDYTVHASPDWETYWKGGKQYAIVVVYRGHPLQFVIPLEVWQDGRDCWESWVQSLMRLVREDKRDARA